MSESINTQTINTQQDGAKTEQKQILKQGKDENLFIYGYRRTHIKTYAIYVLYIVTLGLLRLIFHWFPSWQLYATHSRCSLKMAEKVLVVDKYQDKFKTYFVEDVIVLTAPERRSSEKRSAGNGREQTENSIIKFNVNLGNGYTKELEQLRAVWCKKLCYVWDDDKTQFVKLIGLNKGKKCFDYHKFTGFSKEEQDLRLIIYGKNEIDVPVHTIATLLIMEALTPFYIFQVFSLVVWFAEYYYYYTIAIIVMSVFGITSSIVQTRRNQRSLSDTVHSAETVTVYRGHERYEEIPSSNLVPGDVIEIPKAGGVMLCDAVLLNANCIVNESLLTGESVPVTKTPIRKSDAFYDAKEDSCHTLFCGTNVIQTRGHGNERILAVVLKTGYLTTKGALVRSILYPPPSDFKFDQDSYKFIGILTAIALLGCVYTVISKSERSIAAGDIVIKALDLLTIVVPPALPAAMTMGKLYALRRLKKREIFCVNSRVINVSGSIDCVCFDKTGTLTEDGLDMWGVVPVINNELQEPTTTPPVSCPLFKGMATCHSLTLIDGKLLGDPLDLKVFGSTEWILEDASDICELVKVARRKVTNSREGSIEIEILRQYQFSSNLQRMTVITKCDGGAFEVFCKGSPEMIVSLCEASSIPTDIDVKVQEFTAKGYRVIALGTKVMQKLPHADVQLLERNVAESDLNFCGLIILENRLKPETPGVIKALNEANIKTIMITGDNIQTALSVAKESGIIERDDNIIDVGFEMGTLAMSFEISKLCRSASKRQYAYKDIVDIENGECKTGRYGYAMTGRSWSMIKEYFPEQIPELVANGVVFARMSGEQKQQLIQELQKLGFYVAMCGDGANDCGALKAAHVGISLSEEESSIASPFTSKRPDISCVPKVVKEGRAALTTSIGVFKFMVCYSLTQFASAIILYGIDCNLTSLQFLFIDILLIIHFTSFFGKTEAFKGPLSKDRPPTTLWSVTSIASILCQIVIVVMFQVASYKIVQTYEWFVPFAYDPDKGSGIYYTSYENYAVYCVSVFQYITMAVVFSKGKPFRKPIYTNRILLSSIIAMTLICVYITLYPARWIVSVLELQIPPNIRCGLVIIALAVINFFCSLFAEELVSFLARMKLNLFVPKKKYLDGNQNVRSKLTKDTKAFYTLDDMDEKRCREFVNCAFKNSEIRVEESKL